MKNARVWKNWFWCFSALVVFFIYGREMKKRIHSRPVKVGLGLEQRHFCRLRPVQFSRERMTKRSCQFMGCLLLLLEWRILERIQVLLVQEPVVVNQFPLRPLMYSQIWGLGHSHLSNSPIGSRGGAGRQNCTAGLSVPCSNLEAHKVSDELNFLVKMIFWLWCMVLLLWSCSWVVGLDSFGPEIKLANIGNCFLIQWCFK